MKRTTVAMMMTMALATSTATMAKNDWKETSKDAWIDGKAETTLLLNGNLNSFNIDTHVENGRITLTGKVESEVDKALAEELLVNLDGVSGVDNRLTVDDSMKSRRNMTAGYDKDKAGKMNPQDKERYEREHNSALKDAKIATVVKTRLLFESETSGTSIDVDADNGVVTLKGEVDSPAEKDLAVAIAKSTNDVSRVVDQIQVAK